MLTMDGTMVSVPKASVDEINWSYVMKDPGPGAIYRYGDVFRWKYSNTELTDKNYEKYFDDDLYHTYVGGSNQFNLGGACWLYGITCAVLTVLNFDPKADHQSTAFFAYAGGANALICLGCVFTGIGKARIRAGRNLPDKEFRYLRTVIVTAAVCWGFDSMLQVTLNISS